MRSACFPPPLLPAPANAIYLLPASSASASQECVSAYNELKLNKKYKYIIYKLNDKHTEIIIETASTDGDWETFRGQLVNATTKTRTVGCPICLPPVF